MTHKKTLVFGLTVLVALLAMGAGCADNKTNKQTTGAESAKASQSVNTQVKILGTDDATTTDQTAADDKNSSDQQDTKPEPSDKQTQTNASTNNTQQSTPVVKTEVKTETKTQTTKQPMQITSAAFANGGSIPAEYTCSGSDLNPQLTFANIPDGTKSLVLIMDDPDAPNGTWVHWVVFNIDPKTSGISKGSAPSGATQGKNSWGNSSYGGPCPPSGTHRYYFKLYALDTTLSLSSSESKTSVESAMQGHILAQASLMGRYSK